MQHGTQLENELQKEDHPVEQQAGEYLLAEFKSLREEVLKRTEIQHQLIGVALVALGAFLSFTGEGAPTALLAYPVLATFLAAAWSQSDIRIRQIGGYIHNDIESRFLGLGRGWEHNLRQVSSVGRLGSLAFLTSQGTLVGSQALAVVFFALKSKLPIQDIALLWSLLSLHDLVFLCIDAVSILLALLILKPSKAASKKVLFADHDA